MKRIAIFVILAYAALLILLTWPVLLVSFSIPDKDLPSTKEFFGLFMEPSYWIFIGTLLICQAGLLLIPVKVASMRPTSRRSVYLPIIVSGFLIGSLMLGVICAIGEFIKQGAAFDESWKGWTAIGCCVLIWIIWSFVFCRLTSGQEPQNIVLRQCKNLLHGSVISLLVAVPTHIVARNRDYCCAGIYTFVGIAFGIAVMLLSFGPSVYLLYAERWRKLHPSKEDPDA